jgi:hypothetical protein
MSTSGLNTFNLDLSELVEEAFERCGKELRSGYDLRTARRSLNILTIEWANRGINFWTVEQGQIPININAGQISYPLPVDTIDLLDQVIRTGSDLNQTDINITRISESTYSTIPTKTAYGRPIQVWVDRQSGNTNAAASTTVTATVQSTDTTITVASTANMRSQGYINIGSETILYQNLGSSLTSNENQLLNCYRGVNNTTAAQHAVSTPVYQTFLPNVNIWPTGNPGTQYIMIYWRMRRIQDGGTGINTQDIPFRFIPAMVSGLAYYLSAKLPDMDLNRVIGLKADYEQQFELALGGDTSKEPVRFVPRQLFY